MKPKSNARRFELPVLDFKFSLTEGTNIPPPQPSPVLRVPTPPLTPSLEGPKTDDAATATNGASSSAAATASEPRQHVLTASKSPTDEHMPLSPALSSRQGSIRRLFSRNTLNSAYNDGAAGGSRPVSRAGTLSGGDERGGRRRTSGWFRRLRGVPDADEEDEDGPKSSDELSDDHHRTATLMGPPPPMIPEFGVLQTKRKSGDTWGNDLFKNI
jgi:hypothetical protein